MFICDHGQMFDNNSRWCVNCNKTVNVGHSATGDFAAHSNKVCPTCSAVWPECIDEFLDDFADNAQIQSLFGVGATWH